jgi:hypothetical protein
MKFNLYKAFYLQSTIMGLTAMQAQTTKEVERAGYQCYFFDTKTKQDDF